MPSGGYVDCYVQGKSSGMNWSKTCGALLTGVSIGQQIN